MEPMRTCAAPIRRTASRVAHRAIRALPRWCRLRALAACAVVEKAVDPELWKIPQYMPADRRRVALDVGANNGVTSYVLSRVFETVHAFEPNAELVTQWEDVAPGNVHVWQVALSDTAGDATLLVPRVRGQLLTGWASLDCPGVGTPETHARVSVVRRTLDSLDVSDLSVDFIKIDVEGHELAVLEGARDVLRRWRPWIMVESWDGQRAALLDRLFAAGYEVVDLKAERGIVASPQNIVLRPI